MHNKILTFGLLIINSITMQAQFHTITKESEIDDTGKRNIVYNPDLQNATKGDDGIVLEKDAISVSTLSNIKDSLSSPKCNGYTLPKQGFEYAKSIRRDQEERHQISEDSIGPGNTGNWMVQVVGMPEQEQPVRPHQSPNQNILRV